VRVSTLSRLLELVHGGPPPHAPALYLGPGIRLELLPFMPVRTQLGLIPVD